MIDNWFLYKMLNLVKLEKRLATEKLTDALYKKAKDFGYLDKTIEKISGQSIKHKLYASYKMVDTCAAEFEAETPYFYSTYDEENEAKLFLEHHKSGKKKVLVFRFRPDSDWTRYRV